MIPSDVRLFTWVDVEEVLLRARTADNWPSELLWARAYWDGVEIGIKPGKGNRAKISNWLDEIFDPRFRKSELQILLVSMEGTSRAMPVWVEETEDEPAEPCFKPSLARPITVTHSVERIHPEPLDDKLPPVIALHSFKGGVGRTLMSVALAQAIVGSDDQAKVLLVDGDLEAPGLTWLIEDRFPELPVAFSDFLALVHGDQDPLAKESIELTAENLQSLILNNTYILPAFRSQDQFSSLEIKPEHLIQGTNDPFRLTSLIASLGKELEVNAVIVDLRAGLSELSTGLLLDPRVHKILVTTLSDQSVKGTANLLKLLSDLSLPEKKYEPLPAIIVTKVMKELLDSSFVGESLETLVEAAEPFLASTEDNAEFDTDLPINIIEHKEDLVTLPAEWRRVCDLLERHGVTQKIKSLLDWIPLSLSETPEISQLSDDTTRRDLRRDLFEFSRKLVYAENADVDEFLTIKALRNLATDFSSKTPLAVMTGPKGSGKTYTYLQLIRRQTWGNFVKDALGNQISQKTHICPALKPANLSDRANELVRDCIQSTQKQLELNAKDPPIAISDFLRDKLKEDLHEGDWREVWLKVIAWSMGFHSNQEKLGREAIAFLQKRKQKVVAVIDGLEDFFQDFKEDSAKVALRALLQEVPEWLRQQPDRPLGLILFVREDMIDKAVVQNSQQLLAKYEPYALNWEVKEALRLVHWIVKQTPISLSDCDQDIKNPSFDALSDMLVPLWGRKMGSERSKEARSARWIIAALSDFRGRIQARDLVRFLSISAENSRYDNYWEDRVLVPSAIRSAVKDCGDQKIAELGQETPELKEIFSLLDKVPDESRHIPFAPTEVDLSATQIEILENNGIVTQEEGKYHLAELFRRSLGFKSIGRSKVLKLARQTWQSID
jgi:cellulose biosynthesis protein BcsQ